MANEDVDPMQGILDDAQVEIGEQMVTWVQQGQRIEDLVVCLRWEEGDGAAISTSTRQELVSVLSPRADEETDVGAALAAQLSTSVPGVIPVLVIMRGSEGPRFELAYVKPVDEDGVGVLGSETEGEA